MTTLFFKKSPLKVQSRGQLFVRTPCERLGLTWERKCRVREGGPNLETSKQSPISVSQLLGLGDDG